VLFGLIETVCRDPAGAEEITRSPFETARSPPSEGEFVMESRITIVVDPPPSRLIPWWTPI